MILKFKHKGLKQLHESGKLAGINPQHAIRLRQILALLDTAKTADDLELPGLNLHELKGIRKGYWAVHVSANQRVTFRFQDGHIFDVNYEDYH